MKMAPTAAPALLLACDLGKSGGKFFYKLLDSSGDQQKRSTQALWMDSEVAHRSVSVVNQVGTGGRSQDNAWYRVGETLTFIGKAAQAHLEYNSFKEDKSLKAPERIAGALGAIAHAHHLPSRFAAVVWVLLPIHELSTRSAIASRLQEICRGFHFQDQQAYQITLSLSFRPEGYGIYVNRKQQLEKTGMAIAQRTTWVEMLGHRNGTQLAFETGTLNVAKSTSKFPGFWEVFEKAAIASGVSSPDYGVLLKALETGNAQQYSAAKDERIDLSAAIQQVESGYLAALAPHFNDHLIPGLASRQGDVVLAGRAAYLMRSALRRYFEDRGFSERLSFAWEGDAELRRWLSEQLLEVHETPSIPVRMLDCFGVFQALLGEKQRMRGAA
ncbi:MAG: hypothetical protein ACFB8W_00400 [Elainellaceae cyanobacterium]